MTAKTTTPEQHMMLEAHWPNDCCLCRLEAENAALRERLEAWKLAAKDDDWSSVCSLPPEEKEKYCTCLPSGGFRVCPVCKGEDK